MGRKLENVFGASMLENQRARNIYASRLFEMAMSRGSWHNVPDTIDVRYLEQVLISNGAVVFFHDDVLGYLVLPVTINGQLDVYGNPYDYIAYSNNGYQQQLDINNSVIIYNNYLRCGDVFNIRYYADRLYEYDRVIDVNVRAQKTPVLIKCDDGEILTMKNVYQKFDGNQPVIFGKKSLNEDNLKVLKTDAPYVSDKIYHLKQNIWNEALTSLGIPNSDTTKRERMIRDEVATAQGATIATRNSPEKMRQIACEKINKMFGLNIWYQFDIMENNYIREEGDENVNVYDAGQVDLRSGGGADTE